MPELPEMQALAERLDGALRGETLERVEVLSFAGLKTVEPSPADQHGRTLAGVARRGKYLIFDLGQARVLVHLSQGGRIDIEEPPKRTRPKGAVVRFVFGRTAVLLKEFGTERKAAWWVVAPDDPGPLERLGPEPGTAEFEKLIMEGEDGRRLHTMLRDQGTVAGIGRGFTDDILHSASLSPFASLKKLTAGERRRLIDATEMVLGEATVRERQRTGGLPPKLGDRFEIHNRAGTPCPRCGQTLERVWYESHEIHYCPACQTAGKKLADRRMSRLLK